MSDNESAQKMQINKQKLFKRLTHDIYLFQYHSWIRKYWT